MDRHAHCLQPIDLADFAGVDFDHLPPFCHIKAWNVKYVHVRENDGADLFLTRYGWPLVHQLRPEAWYDHRQYATQGHKLSGGTGSVFYHEVETRMRRRIGLVIKFSRLAQTVPLAVHTDGAAAETLEEIRGGRFNGPFEEFGQLLDLRSRKRPDGAVILTKRPLAIFSPAKKHALWRMGRMEQKFRAYQRRLTNHLQRIDGVSIELDIQRDYILIFQWVVGRNAEEFFDDGDLPEQDFLALTPRVEEELAAVGYLVLDNKPPHFILRKRRRNGQFLKRRGKLAYALIDFELLEPLPDKKWRQFAPAHQPAASAAPAQPDASH